eukprot:TRINITY_DN3805_c0_g1_i1.p2 TRINITY_DN3805_c0_g1~~TRINITY_DN3805_c0_g1_i1.p2  ORF type:complete len:114 (-),score=37.86 TRINITY_DN3805_c0_g1_i1:8-349(-)
MNITNMLTYETIEITNIDDEIASIIQDQMPKVFFLYGPHDGYAPKAFHDELKERFPGVSAELADESIPHAFVTTHHGPVADHITPWIAKILGPVEDVASENQIRKEIAVGEQL